MNEKQEFGSKDPETVCVICAFSLKENKENDPNVMHKLSCQYGCLSFICSLCPMYSKCVQCGKLNGLVCITYENEMKNDRIESDERYAHSIDNNDMRDVDNYISEFKNDINENLDRLDNVISNIPESIYEQSNEAYDDSKYGIGSDCGCGNCRTCRSYLSDDEKNYDVYDDDDDDRNDHDFLDFNPNNDVYCFDDNIHRDDFYITMNIRNNKNCEYRHPDDYYVSYY